jgi:isopenicillin N synthase-like dioxygenase
MAIPNVSIRSLFGPASKEREATDEAIFAAAINEGFLTVTDLPYENAVNEVAKRSLLALFSLPAEKQRRLWKQNFEPNNPNLYRGWFPLHSGKSLSREGFEVGPDIVRQLPGDTDDLLYQPTPLPDEDDLPGFLQTARQYYLAMESTGNQILASLSRGLGIPETIFAEAFRDGISTLRLLHYIPRKQLPISAELKQTRGAHVDTGLLTILAPYQGGAGLQAMSAKGEWIDVPPREGSFAVNFGGLLERWTGGRIRATQHGVLPSDEERFSIPFFFEPRPDTLIKPLPIDGIAPFAAFLFGDHLWATTTRFSENYGLEHLRPHRAAYKDPIS